MTEHYLKQGLKLLAGSLLTLGILASCTGSSPPLLSGFPLSAGRGQTQAHNHSSQNFLQQGFSQERIRKRQAELAQFRQKPAYLGPISVKIDTGRISEQKRSGKVVDLSGYVAERAADFSVQAVPDGPVVFQEQFTKRQDTFEVTRAFSVANLSSRYTLHVERLNQGEGSVEVNVNGTDWILEKDFSGQVTEVQRDALLLNSNNSLRVRLKGNPGLSVKVTLVEGGQAGTILRRQGKLGMPGETHQTHLKQNDVNIFDPNDPNSLGGLTPFAGVEQIETNQKVYAFSELAINGVPIQIENARMLMVFRDEAKKQAFLEAWHAEVESEEYGMCLVKFDLSKAPLQNLDALIRNANTRMAADITDVSASSFDGLRTFAIILDVLKNYGEDYFYADPNYKLSGSQAAPVSPISPSDWDDGLQSWWLNDTKVREAWNYSIGTGIRVAWLDNGTDFANRGHAELIRRTDLNPLFGNLRITGGDALAVFNDHSLHAQMVGFAERDNFAKTVGVAPNTTVIPYNVLTHSDKAMDSMKAVGAAAVHVVGSSYGCLNCRDDAFRFFENELGGGDVLTDAIDYIVNSLGIPYVQSAGNGGSKFSAENGIHVNKNIPRGDINNIIMVGAVVPPSTSGIAMGVLLNRHYNRLYFSSDYQVAYYSNYGENVVYAPGEGIQISAKDPSNSIFAAFQAA